MPIDIFRCPRATSRRFRSVSSTPLRVPQRGEFRFELPAPFGKDGLGPLQGLDIAEEQAHEPFVRGGVAPLSFERGFEELAEKAVYEYQSGSQGAALRAKRKRIDV